MHAAAIDEPGEIPVGEVPDPAAPRDDGIVAFHPETGARTAA
jgi:hypothetical protein